MEGDFVMRTTLGTSSTRREKKPSLPGLIALAACFAVGALDGSRVWAANGANGKAARLERFNSCARHTKYCASMLVSMTG